MDGSIRRKKKSDSNLLNFGDEDRGSQESKYSESSEEGRGQQRDVLHKADGHQPHWHSALSHKASPEEEEP